MNIHTQKWMLSGPIGVLECALDNPDTTKHPTPKGIALVAHPHPLYGGTMDNKVVHTLARALVALGYVVARMNFRGVGLSEGTHDDGCGETDDMQLLLTSMQHRHPGLPIVLAGFSFGTFVQAQLQQRLATQGQTVHRLILVGAAAGKWAMPLVPANTILIHGEQDDTIPLQAVLDWARPQDLPLIVVPGADHFFHRKLHHIKNTLLSLLR